jgi:hypothetical protein
MRDEYYYIIYRVISRSEARDHYWYDMNVNDERKYFYGWTLNKNVVKAFIKQRDRKKYHVEVISKDDIESEEYVNLSIQLDRNNMINYICLKSSKDNEEYKLFITHEEMFECEKRILRIFRELSSLSKMLPKEEDNNQDKLNYFIKIFTSLKDKYIDALHILGFRPFEIDARYDNINGEANIYDLVDPMYDDYYDYNEFDFMITKPDELPEVTLTGDYWATMFYSLESFIKVLKDNL